MDNALVWKPCNFIDFTGSEIIMKPKVYMVLHFTRWIVVRRHTHSTWKATKVYRKMEQWKQMHLTFVKQRKLQVDLSKSAWYAVRWSSIALTDRVRVKRWHAHQQWASSGDTLLSNHHRCSVANIQQRLAWLKVILLTFVHYRICDCLSENRPSSYLAVFREIPF